jgi:hypothetical protein
MTLPDEATVEVLDFVHFLKSRRAFSVIAPTHAIDFSVFDAASNTYGGPLGSGCAL